MKIMRHLGWVSARPSRLRHSGLLFWQLRCFLVAVQVMTVFVTAQQSPAPVTLKPTNAYRKDRDGIRHDRPLRDRPPVAPPSPTIVTTDAPVVPTVAPANVPSTHAPDAARLPRPNNRGPTKTPVQPFQPMQPVQPVSLEKNVTCSTNEKCVNAAPIVPGIINGDGTCQNGASVFNYFVYCGQTLPTSSQITANWFVYTPSADCQATLTINAGGTFQVFGGSCAELTCLNSNTFFGSFSWRVTSNNPYYIVAYKYDSFNSVFMTFRLTLECV